MLAKNSRFYRVFGDNAVLTHLEQLGKNPRTYANLVEVGFPEIQLEEARRWYLEQATTPVERYAAQKMAQGFFEDESLLNIFCRYYECTDWKLVKSPWFYSKEDYRRFYRAVLDPIAFHIARLEEGGGEEIWDVYFQKIPFDLGMGKSLSALWDEIASGEYFWAPQTSYGHFRASNMLGYLYRNVNIHQFTPHQFNYVWEKNYRKLLEPLLVSFREVLERAVRRWEESRREKNTRHFHYQAFSDSQGIVTRPVRQALEFFGLDLATVSHSKLKNTFRQLSKKAHPDSGGSSEEFRRLSAYKDIIESWLNNSAAGSPVRN